MINNLLLAALIVCLLFESCFFFSLALIFRSIEKKPLRILNTFIFETTPSFKEKNGVVNYFLFFSILINVFPYIFYASHNIDVYTVSMLIISVLFGFCLSALPFISLNKLREHFYLFFGALLSLIAISGIEGFYCYHLYSVYTNKYGIAAMVVAIILAALLLAIVFNPKLFDLKNKQNEDGTYSRKKFIFLAFSEWMLYPIALLTLLPLFLVTMA